MLKVHSLQKTVQRFCFSFIFLFSFFPFFFSIFTPFEAVLKSGSLSYGKYWKLKFRFKDFKSHGSLDFLANGKRKIENICVKHQNTVGL